jgi:hypothetical protein
MKNNSKIFTKNQFSSKKKNKEEIDEFFDLDDSNVNPRYNNQIFTNVPHSGGDNSEFEQGIPTITDKLSLYANPRNWWQLYLRGFPLIRTYGLFENDFKDMIKELLNSKDVDNELEQRAMSLFPGLKDQMLRGQSLREAADPWLNTIANTLEIDVKSLDLNNDTVQQVLNFTDEKGNIKPMNLYSAKKAARRHADFDFTQQAKEEKTNIAGTILKDHGYLA